MDGMLSIVACVNSEHETPFSTELSPHMSPNMSMLVLHPRRRKHDSEELGPLHVTYNMLATGTDAQEKCRGRNHTKDPCMREPASMYIVFKKTHAVWRVEANGTGDCL